MRSRISGINGASKYPDTLVIRGVEVRRLSNKEALARNLTTSGRWYVYPNDRLVLSHVISEALETDPRRRELNAINAKLDPDEVSCWDFFVCVIFLPWVKYSNKFYLREFITYCKAGIVFSKLYEHITAKGLLEKLFFKNLLWVHKVIIISYVHTE